MKLSHTLGAVATLLAFALMATSARAEELVSFAPSGAWTANFADDSCSLERSFTHEQDALRLRIRQFVPGGSFEITIASETLNPRRRTSSIEFTAAGDRQRIEYYQTFHSPDGPNGIVFSASLTGTQSDDSPSTTSDYAVYATGSVVNRLTLSKAFGSELSILTGSLEQPLKVMESCLDDLLTEWGVDPQAHRSLVRKAEPNWSDDWLKVSAPMQRDFSQQRSSDRQQVRLIIDARGKVIGCRVLQWPDDEPIARRLCDAYLESAQIPPALNAESVPISSYYVIELRAIPRTEFR